MKISLFIFIFSAILGSVFGGFTLNSPTNGNRELPDDNTVGCANGSPGSTRYAVTVYYLATIPLVVTIDNTLPGELSATVLEYNSNIGIWNVNASETSVTLTAVFPAELVFTGDATLELDLAVGNTTYVQCLDLTGTPGTTTTTTTTTTGFGGDASVVGKSPLVFLVSLVLAAMFVL